jgi:hypothetical protein
LTSVQVAAGFRIGDTYRRYYRAKKLRITPKSPSFERNFGDGDVAEERMTLDQIRVLEAQVRKAEEAWAKIKGHMATLPGNVETAVMDVCVEDRPTNPTLYPELRWVLDQMSKRWAPEWDEMDKRRAPHRIKAAMYQKVEPVQVRPKDRAPIISPSRISNQGV